jgi:peptidoglycan/LPS O-acetylase OafA/YrhL
MKEIKPLTSLRAFAAFLVFMFHYANVYLPANRGVEFCCEWIPFPRLWQQGYVGVSIFFVLSGFLITRIYFDGIVHRTKSLRLFFVKRVARIWPLFLVYTVIQHVGLVWQGTPITSDFWVTLTMTQGFFFDLRYEGLPTAWSLTVEESFYVFAPLFFVAIAAMAPAERRDNAGHGFARILRVLLAVLGVAVVMILIGDGLTRLLRTLGWTWKGLMGNHYHLWHATLFGRMPEFAIGVFCAFLHRNGWVGRHIKSGLATALIVIAFVGIGACMWGKSYTVYRPETLYQLSTYAMSYLLTLLTGLLILALTVEGNILHRFLSWRVFVYLGKTSYGFYLVQITVMIAPMVWLTDQLGWARLPVLYVLANLFCAATYEWVEVPARRWIIKAWGGSR